MNAGNDSNDFPPGEGGHGAADTGAETLNTGRPAVAAAPGKLAIVVILVVFFVFIIARSLFFGGSTETKEAKKQKGTISHGIGKGDADITISPDSFPSPTADMTAPTPPPPPPPPPPQLTAPPTPELHASGPTNEALSRRIHSPMITVGGHGISANAQAARHRAAVAASNDPNSAYAQSVSESEAQKAVAGKVENLDITIIQGKLIHAVLESAIDSDLPGPIRAIVSHDVYAEAGREVLIPKGSRLIGAYNSQIRRGQNRVFIIWQRVIRPDGIDVMIDSPGVDSLGRAGMAGDVDNKYFEMFSTALMTSALDVGVAAVGDALFGNQQTTTTNNGAGSTTTESPTAAAMQEAVTNIGSVGSNIVNNVLNEQPTIYVDQGSQINVFVNRDLIFPREIIGRTGFVQ